MLERITLQRMNKEIKLQEAAAAAAAAKEAQLAKAAAMRK
jgi:hypothetical protein